MTAISRGVPFVTSMTANQIVYGAGDIPPKMVDAITSARTTGVAQIIVTGFNNELAARVKANLQCVFDGMTLEGERFTVTDPRPLIQDSVRIDVTCSGSGQENASVPISTEVIPRMTAEQMRVLGMTFQEYIETEQRRYELARAQKALSTRLLAVLLNQGTVTHVWHMCEHSVAHSYSRPQGVGEGGAGWFAGTLADYGLRMPMQFHPDDRAKLVAATREYK